MAHQITIHDIATGETVTRDFTDAEQTQYLADNASSKKTQADREAAAAAKKSAYKKLAALGLTADEIAAL